MIVLFIVGVIPIFQLSVFDVLEITIDRSLNVSFGPKVKLPLPSFLGDFEASFFSDAASALNVPNTLTIRVDGIDKIFNLHGEEYVAVKLGTGYYREVSVVIDHGNILVIVERMPAPTAVPPLPTSRPTVIIQTVVVTRPSVNVRCDGLLPRLQVGGRGRVNRYPNRNNRVRSSPNLSGAQLGVIEAGHEFRVLDGPICEDGINWWLVRSTDDELEGWTAEGEDGDYYVEPL